ncbi:RtcB family protein [Desulfobacterales bacterium HSG17]|nr:RtcB family protein [Desulfobacterales bacterium HSG17]
MKRFKEIIIKPHIVLQKAGYDKRSDYPLIINYALKVIKKHDIQHENELLSLINEKFAGSSTGRKCEKTSKQIKYFGIPGKDFDSEAIDQMKTVMRLPVACQGALMPDAHKGYSMPIGGVVSLDSSISPAFIGFDIGCQMALTILQDISPEDVKIQKRYLLNSLLNVTHFGKGNVSFADGPRDHAVMENPLWNEIKLLKKIKQDAYVQLGSSGKGNHFVDIVIGKMTKKVSWLPLDKGSSFVGILSHSGSGKIGQGVAAYYMKIAETEVSKIAKGIPKGYEWLSYDKDSGKEYFAAMNLMGKYARANHILIHKHFMKQIGGHPLIQIKDYHNFAWKQANGTFIHRKGATPADIKTPGLILGTSATPSYLTEGLGNRDSLSSSSHGAGRILSRKKAKAAYDKEAVKKAYKEADVLTYGVADDENPYAYKDISHVMNLQENILVHTIAIMKPSIVVMGG